MNRYPDRFTALLDACVLGGVLRRNILLSLAAAGLFQPRWSARILAETQKAIAEITGGEADDSRQRSQIEKAFPEAAVAGYEIFEDSFTLPDPKDNHVLAAAIAASVSIIVTDNLSDFPEESLEPHGVEAISADAFIADTIELDPSQAILALKRMRERFTRPAFDAITLIHDAEAKHLLQTATIMEKYQAFL